MSIPHTSILEITFIILLSRRHFRETDTGVYQTYLGRCAGAMPFFLSLRNATNMSIPHTSILEITFIILLNRLSFRPWAGIHIASILPLWIPGRSQGWQTR